MKQLKTGCVLGCLGVMIAACGGTTPVGNLGPGGDAGSGGQDGSMGSSTDGGHPGPTHSDAAVPTIGDAGGKPADAAVVYTDGEVAVATTIYANSDSQLFQLDPATNAVTMIGTFVGNTDASTDSVITDVAVNAAGGLFACSESVLYSVTLPATPGTGAMVQLTHVATLGSGSTSKDAGVQRFYALGFAPAGLLGSGEMLVAGDGQGELWSVDPTSGAIQDLGNFGKDPNTTGNLLALSGDVVFYTDYGPGGPGSGPGTVRALATIRSCKGTSCTAPSDYLAAIDVNALKSNFASNSHTVSLLGGIYGAPLGPDGGSSGTGAGTGFKDIYGLGAWQGSVFGFTYAYTTDAGASPPQLITIDTSSGKGTAVPTANLGFTKYGWAGAGVTTSVTITLPPPPPPPPQPQ